MAEKTWGGRFKEKVNELVDRFNASISFDRALYHEDIVGSVAHCKALAKAGVLTEEESRQIIEALGEIEEELERGPYPNESEFEDIHTLVELSLIHI